MEIFRALGALIEPPSESLAVLAEALDLGPLPGAGEHTELFLFQLYPYASVYLGAEGMMGGGARDLIAGFWRALALSPPAEPDHLSVMLAFYTGICELEESTAKAEQRARWRHVRKAFLWEHLLSWLPAYLDQVQDLASPFYKQWSVLLTVALAEEAGCLGEPEQISAHLLEAPGLIDPREDEFPKFLDSLLSPVRSGMILTRADLLRAARKLNIGIRMGERKYILTAMFEQEAKGMIAWLAEEAQGWGARHQKSTGAFGATAQFWEAKAADTANLLLEISNA